MVLLKTFGGDSNVTTWLDVAVTQTVLSHDYPYPGGHPTHLLCIYTEISGTLHILRCRRLA